MSGPEQRRREPPVSGNTNQAGAQRKRTRRGGSPFLRRLTPTSEIVHPEKRRTLSKDQHQNPLSLFMCLPKSFYSTEKNQTDHTKNLRATWHSLRSRKTRSDSECEPRLGLGPQAAAAWTRWRGRSAAHAPEAPRHRRRAAEALRRTRSDRSLARGGAGPVRRKRRS